MVGSKMNMRLLVISSIPTLAALLGFFWFRKKKKPPAIEDRKPSARSEVSVEESTLRAASASQNEVHNDGMKEAQPQVEEERVQVDNNNQTSNVVSAIIEAKDQEPEPELNMDMVKEIEAMIVQEEEIKVAVVSPMQAQVHNMLAQESVPVNASASPQQSQAAPKSIEEENEMVIVHESETKETVINELTSNCSVAQHEGQDKVTDVVSASEPVLNHMCEDSEKSSASQQTQQQNGHGSGKCEVDVKVREGSHDSAVSMSSPSPSDSAVNGGTPNNCDAHSEVSSDSGKGTSVPETTSLATPNDMPEYVIYEFDFPSELCGRLIGKQGKNINVIKSKSGAEITLRKQPFVRDYQTCCVEGNQAQVTLALEQIKKRFPTKQFSDLTYEQTNTVKEVQAVLCPEIMQLSLPEGVSVDVIVSSVVDANHVFVQQPTHPSFTSLEKLNYCMNMCYTGDSIVPQLPRPIEVGVICAAPMFNGWYRAQVVAYLDETEEVDIKYVDYGGYMRVSSCVLRQIRSDFTMLPFQAVEAYLANVIPPNDDEMFATEASASLESLVQGKMLQGQIVSHEEDGVPYIQLYELLPEGAVFINRELVNQGVARWIEMSS